MARLAARACSASRAGVAFGALETSVGLVDSFLAGAFLAGAFLAGAFLAGAGAFLGSAFFTGALFAGAGAFLAGAADFLVAALLPAAFLGAVCLLAAGLRLGVFLFLFAGLRAGLEGRAGMRGILHGSTELRYAARRLASFALLHEGLGFLEALAKHSPTQCPPTKLR